MAGRGRGRGRSNLSFNVEELGFSRGEALPTGVLQPPPRFPGLTTCASPLLTGEKYDYLQALKQEYRNTAIESPFYVKVDTRRRDVERYTDKYQQSSNNDYDIQWKPDWNRFPVELRLKTKSKAKPIMVKRTKDITETLNDLEKKETVKEAEGSEEEEDEEKDKEEDEEAEIEEDEAYDEELEEETDYLMSYFDNGEALDEEEDNLDDGPTY